MADAARSERELLDQLLQALTRKLGALESGSEIESAIALSEGFEALSCLYSAVDPAEGPDVVAHLTGAYDICIHAVANTDPRQIRVAAGLAASMRETARHRTLRRAS